jgi:hypothetical protein
MVTMGLGFNLLIYGGARMATCPSTKTIRPACQLPNLPPINICLSEVKLTSFGAIPSLVAARLSILAHGQELSFFFLAQIENSIAKEPKHGQELSCRVQGVKLKGYYPYFGVQPFTFPSKYFATLQKGRGHFM